MYNDINILLDLAKSFFQKLIKVIPRTTNIIYPTDTDPCQLITVASSDKTTGIASSDLHIYVTYSNDSTKTDDITSTACLVNPNPVIALLNFNIANILISTN